MNIFIQTSKNTLTEFVNNLSQIRIEFCGWLLVEFIAENSAGELTKNEYHWGSLLSRRVISPVSSDL